MERIILHSDCNSFYASVECLHHPEIREKPVAVGGDIEQRHDIILAKNQLAKQFHVSTGEAIWQAKQKCPELIVLPPDFPLYLRFSRLARDIYLDYSSRVEPFGLDEAWLDITSRENQKDKGEKTAQEIRKRIREELGITVSIGVSYNKIFAKLGSDYRKPDAVTLITKENYRQIAWPLPVSDLLYVGPATKRKLNGFGVHTIGELAQTPVEILRSKFGKIGDILWCFSNGLDSSPVADFQNQPIVKSIGNSTTAPRDLESGEDVKMILYVLADSVARRLREQGLKGRTIHISVRDNSLFSFTRQKTLLSYTNLTGEIAREALSLFREHYQWKRPVRSVGISVSDLEADTICSQTGLFCDEVKREKMERLDKALDRLKVRFGTFAVQPAVLLKDRKLSGFDTGRIIFQKDCPAVAPSIFADSKSSPGIVSI